MRTQSQIHVRPVFCWLMSDKILRFVLDEFFILEFFLYRLNYKRVFWYIFTRETRVYSKVHPDRTREIR